MHPLTSETITQYQKLAKDPVTKEVWMTGFQKEFDRIEQGDTKMGTKGTNYIFAMSHSEIANIPEDRVVTYAQVVIDYQPQKEDPNRVRITAGANLTQYPGELTTQTADLAMAKLLWNSVLSTPGAKFMALDVGNFYLMTPMD